MTIGVWLLPRSMGNPGFSMDFLLDGYWMTKKKDVCFLNEFMKNCAIYV